MKIKPLSKKKVKAVGHWADGHFIEDKIKSRGRLPQLSKRLRRKITDVHATP